ncbi:MAG TPA: nuclear transport factor 2 family protein [Thermoanaerobaculia bacterium]|nr:nuclear transport factor 2 family protein [Thermoanaerobaculia bacterium]
MNLPRSGLGACGEQYEAGGSQITPGSLGLHRSQGCASTPGTDFQIESQGGLMICSRPFVLVLALLGLSAVALSAQVPDDLRRTMDQRAEAIHQADADVWDRLTADAFTVVRPDGRLMTRAERLDELRTQTRTHVPPEEQEHVQIHGDVVVRRLRSGDVWVLEVWVRGQRGWQVSITQLTQAGQ